MRSSPTIGLALLAVVACAALGYPNRAFGQTTPDAVEKKIQLLEGQLANTSREGSLGLRNWAVIQNNIGLAYLGRSRGERLQNIEHAIGAMETALSVLKPDQFQAEWASVRANLGSAYHRLGTAYFQQLNVENGDNIERAITAFQKALTILTQETSALAWARTQDDLGLAYLDRISGNREENLELAIGAFEAALPVLRRESSASEWARAQQSLGIAYSKRLRGERADNVDLTIKAYEAALTAWTPERARTDWAVTHELLGYTYRDRIHGNAADNIELAIQAYQAALTVRTQEDSPEAWASAQTALGATYLDRIRGGRADNIELAIGTFELCLSESVRKSAPATWALAQNYLGVAYSSRLLENTAENIELAIKAYEAALTVRTHEGSPFEWATTQVNLGAAYAKRTKADKNDNLGKAIKAYGAALTVFTRENRPRDWALAQLNLGQIYLEPAAVSRKYAGSRYQGLLWHITDAIRPFEAALTVFNPGTTPKEWALAQGSLGTAYMASPDAGPDRFEAATKAFRAALTVFTRDVYPRDHLWYSTKLGEALSSKQDWTAAAETFSSAREAFLVLFGEGVDEAEADDLAASAGRLFPDSAYAAVKLGHLDAAFDLLDEGKARLAGAALRQRSADLSVDERDSFELLRSSIRSSNQELAKSTGSDRLEALDRLQYFRRELLGLMEKVKGQNLQQADQVLRRSLIPSGGAIVAPIVTASGSEILILTSSHDVPTLGVLDLPGLSTNSLAYLMPDWLDEDRQNDTNRWFARIDSTCRAMWRWFAGPLDQALRQRGVKEGGRIVWMPLGDLGLLPIGLAQDEVTGRRFGENYEITSIPSFQALAAAAKTAAAHHLPWLLAVNNPTANIRGMNLPFADIEGKLVASHFSEPLRQQFDRSNATAETVLAHLEPHSYWHFSAHGRFDWSNARNSGLVMSDNGTLTVDALLHHEDVTRTPPRLVVLSACETGLYDPNLSPDEFIGLPTSFIQLGAAGVVAALWKVDDLSTTLLMARFYDLFLDERFSPITALRQAQFWLRDATRKDLTAYIKAVGTKVKLDQTELARMESQLDLSVSVNVVSTTKALVDVGTSKPNTVRKERGRSASKTTDRVSEIRPFAHPYYWGGFFYTGL
jgi:CHAT domain-containing protein/tetratricopeptide (TPR) repeat protein